jgi:hypothetical protein
MMLERRVRRPEAITVVCRRWQRRHRRLGVGKRHKAKRTKAAA